ncbi:MAG: chromate transporter [Verrucomicrobiota bacterium]|jgi:chromate transporter|nr:chromate transporter [Verrucomicrobiota bacterium]MDK2963391.1 chromate transporter [Verrucomicrobiota bacterium]
MKKNLKELAFLYTLFFRIGLFSIGGGYVMLPMLRRELMEKRGWVDDQELLDYYAIAQATPGLIAVNTSTFVGFKRRGIPGAVAATAGMVSPSLIVILMIAAFIPRMEASAVFQKAFRGIRVAVTVLLAGTLFSLIRKSWKSAGEILFTITAFLAVVLFQCPPIPIIIAAGLAGIVLSLNKRNRK